MNASLDMARETVATAVLQDREIQLMAWDNGVGLGRDLRLLAEVLEAAGARVTVSRFSSGHAKAPWAAWSARLRRMLARLRGEVRDWRYDANVMLERLRPHHFALARRNLFIPNPEWFSRRNEPYLPRLDGVLCKTRHAVEIFRRRDCRSHFIGFTTHDCLRADVSRQRAFFHLAGRSRTKGTAQLLALWRRHPEWPMLTVVQHPSEATGDASGANIRHIVDYLPEERLRALQNAHRFHLCPSQAEGFGHYLCEAMSVGAVTITLDAAPMNELVSAERGILVACHEDGRQGLVPIQRFDDAAMEAAVARALAMQSEEQEVIGERARAWFEANDARFRRALPQVLAECLETPTSPK